ncbi:MotA/TolQ/ExbB proton channel family protein [Leptospira meyeri]|uniref:Biopolymer transport protein ExbB n=1 Tax=Leptospira meyeri TaxID=29508 RepID=A0A4R8MUM9_LEPME|nr:MotA/TolQ/ExbB proton channel family protein [Leptospira meyeri]EKJ88240.1 transporter, MotA/TolQ/ExbB proton channel family protein [Leptospira meyeri serovar Hardjo str. Went 5]EMJ88165.1 transporter, MotA/TolQ/ExbB proton channel family protein [Leptospira meyeri serovar Semaranga str. Veldrot Semarang 173]TDY73073.1 biopolymer transport protein ExbB [Leptospira meyeri]TGL51152.1 MotA/TolQ/ExbB proton channel family protein [Leptospira meyeri]
MNFSCNLTKKKIALSFVTLLITIFTLAGKIEAQATPAAPTTESTQTTEAPAETPAPVAEAPAEAPQQESEIGLVKLFVTGGWSMWPLLLSSIVGFGVILERMYFFFTAKLIRKGYNQDLQDAIDASGMNGIEEFLKANEGQKITDVLKNGMEVSQNDPEIFAAGIEREAGEVMTLLEKGLTVLSAVSTIAPLVGFLGTVSGMINAFDAIANADQVNAKVVAGGIKEALITTAAGLIVAIPAMTFYQYLQGRVAFFTSEVEEAANKIYKEYLKLKAGKKA